MSDKVTLFEYDTSIGRAETVTWLRELADRLATDGTLHFASNGEEHIVATGDPIDLEIEATHKKDRTKLEIELSWEGGTPALKAH